MPDPHTIARRPRGKLNFCPVSPPRPCGAYVYQLTGYGKGNVPGDPHRRLQLRAYVIPIDPKTPAQLARRATFAAAVAAWHGLSPAQKASYARRGKSRNLPGYNLFISAYLRSH